MESVHYVWLFLLLSEILKRAKSSCRPTLQSSNESHCLSDQIMIRLGNIVLRNASCCATKRFLVPSQGLQCVGPSLKDLRDIHSKTPFAMPSPPQHQSYRLKSTKGKKGKGGAGGKPDIDDLIDALSDDEFEEEAEPDEELNEFKETPLSKLLKSSRKGPSGKGGSKKDSGKQGGGGSVIKYEMFVRVLDGEKLWQELESVVVNLKQYYIQHLSVRSATSLDNLPVELEGDKYPLNELALISKKDPKRLVIDASSFPQATANIMSAIRDAGMNLNPQQDGLRIFVPIPKVLRDE